MKKFSNAKVVSGLLLTLFILGSVLAGSNANWSSLFSQPVLGHEQNILARVPGPAAAKATVTPTPSAKAQDDRITKTEIIVAETRTVAPQSASGPVTNTLSDPTAEQIAEQERIRGQRRGRVPFPVDASSASPVTPSNDPPTPLPGSASQQTNAPEAANDFVTRSIHDFTSTEAPTAQRLVIHEPSLGVLGDTIFYTGNRYAARSTDGGQTFTYVSPYTTFSSVNSGFCCDQVVNSVPLRNMMIWALQYYADASSGTLRIARAIGSQVAANAWTSYDFTPQFFGFAANNWMDYPNLTVSSNFLYGTSNVFSTNCPGGNCPFTGNVVFRIPLAELATGGTVNVTSFIRTDTGTLRCTEGATTTMFCGAAQSTTSTRIFTWPDSGSIVLNDVTINAYTRLNRDGVATSPDGSNWAARSDSRIMGAYVRGGVMGFMWGAKQSTGRPYPYVIVAQFNTSNRAFVSQGDIWSDQIAWLYPQASVNSAGNLGGLINYGGGSFYPNVAAWLVDDVTPSITPLTGTLAATSGNRGPTANVWGDYLTTRQHSSDTNTYVAAAFSLSNGGSDSNSVPRYFRFGRERDFPACNAPGAFSLTSPSNGQSLASTSSVNLTWQASANANSYDVYFGTSSNPPFLANQAGTSRSVSVTPGQTYFWKVVARVNCNGALTTTTATWSFSVQNPCGTSVPILVGQTLTGQLMAGDCTTLFSDGSFADFFSFNGTAGQQIAISLNSASFNAYLVLIDPGNVFIAQNDDGGGGTNARIPATSGFFTLPATGTYRIAANTFPGQTGNYSITLSGPSGLQFFPLNPPVRLLDTRLGQPACSNPGAPIAGGGTLTQIATGGCTAIPATASAVTGNVTAVSPSANGFLTLYPSDASQPFVANNNYRTDRPFLGNVFTVGLGAGDRAFRLYSSATANVIVDVTGYYAPPASGGLYFHPLPAPVRLLDTRIGQTACTTPGSPILAGQELLQLGNGICSIPSTARVLVGNATAVNPLARGNITLFQGNISRPPITSGNYEAGLNLNSPFHVALSSSGQFRIYSSAQIDMVVDILGYYSLDPVDVNGAGLFYKSLTPVRLLDTRVGATIGCVLNGFPLQHPTEYSLGARGTCTIDAAAVAIIGNATVVAPATNGFLTLWPSNASRPFVATSNYLAGINFNRFFTVGLGTDGRFNLYASTTSTNLVLDVSGFFVP